MLGWGERGLSVVTAWFFFFLIKKLNARKLILPCFF